MSREFHITLPLEDSSIIKELHAGDIVYINGIIYTARDAAHKRFCELISKGEKLPIDVNNGAIYYVGPTPAKPGKVIGSAGPTSSYRMDPYSEDMMKQGLKVMIGKGSRSDDYKKCLVKYGAVYLSTIGGAAASIAESIKECELICYEDLGAEAVRRLVVKDFYTIVTYDSYGVDLFNEGVKQYKR